MTTIFWLLVAIAVALCLLSSGQWYWRLRDAPRIDEAINQDQYREELTRRLASLQGPAAKGFDSRLTHARKVDRVVGVIPRKEKP